MLALPEAGLVDSGTGSGGASASRGDSGGGAIQVYCFLNPSVSGSDGGSGSCKGGGTCSWEWWS